MLLQIGLQEGGDSVRATRPHLPVSQDVGTGCASCQRAGEKWGLGRLSKNAIFCAWIRKAAFH